MKGGVIAILGIDSETNKSNNSNLKKKEERGL